MLPCRFIDVFGSVFIDDGPAFPFGMMIPGYALVGFTASIVRIVAVATFDI